MFKWINTYTPIVLKARNRPKGGEMDDGAWRSGFYSRSVRMGAGDGGATGRMPALQAVGSAQR